MLSRSWKRAGRPISLAPGSFQGIATIPTSPPVQGILPKTSGGTPPTPVQDNAACVRVPPD